VTGPDVTVSRVTDFAAVEAKWRDLETRSEPSFFQSWTWTGCLVEERFPDPVLVEAHENGRTVALALFNRRGRTLYLGESGDHTLDCVYIEFNGILAESGSEVRLTTACLRAMRSGSGAWSLIAKPSLVLSGISAMTAAAAGHAGLVRSNRSLSAPLVDLTSNDNRFLDSRSANTRQQLRRSDRHYMAIGDIAIERAETITEGYEFFDALAVLHQATWLARGKPGAFANPFFGRFHRALIARGLAGGEIDLLRVTTGSQAIGFLYNFLYRSHSLAYQSGFDYVGAGRHGKPGMTCHHEAIRFAARRGAIRYDFLAGEDRYKRSLSDRADVLHWVEVADPWSPRLLVRRAFDLVGDFVAPRRWGGSTGRTPPSRPDFNGAPGLFD
jgi:CelD/BcsL family acetyltransferase involved in cellulose biosynthesis